MSQPSESVRILVWDWPVRVFHWLTVLSFAGAYLTAESERWRLVHITLGYTLGGLFAFRLVWGVVGTHYALFSNFVRGPSAIFQYLKSLRSQRPEHHLGHNPAGAVAIVLLLSLGMGIVATGYCIYNDIGGEWLSEWHEAIGNAMLLVVIGHIAGVISASWMHRENLARSMLTGYKQGSPEQAIRRNWAAIGALVLVCVLGFWCVQWNNAPEPVATDSATLQPMPLPKSTSASTFTSTAKPLAASTST